MKSSPLSIDISGQGQPLILLHGWGVNSSIFTPLTVQLPQYSCWRIDLPGFGDSQPIAGGFDAWVDAIAAAIPDQSIILGWSLGGLLATAIAQRYPVKLAGLITVASSPCFLAKPEQDWPGIAPQVLRQFAMQLQQDLSKTVERFLALQAMGSNSARDDIRIIRELVLAKPQPDSQALAAGLDMLRDIDLRGNLPAIISPWLRLWGKLDGLVPRKVLPQLLEQNNTTDVLFAKASHAPFISHTEQFVAEINQWCAEKGLI